MREGAETNQTVCFTRGQAHLWADEALRILWGRHRTREVAAVLVDQAPTTSKALADALDLTKAGIRHHLRKLRRHQLVGKVRSGLKVRYRPAPKLQVWVDEHRETIREHGQSDET